MQTHSNKSNIMNSFNLIIISSHTLNNQAIKYQKKIKLDLYRIL